MRLVGLFGMGLLFGMDCAPIMRSLNHAITQWLNRPIIQSLNLAGLFGMGLLFGCHRVRASRPRARVGRGVVIRGEILTEAVGVKFGRLS